jgi:hypothetical protein
MAEKCNSPHSIRRVRRKTCIKPGSGEGFGGLWHSREPTSETAIGRPPSPSSVLADIKVDNGAEVVARSNAIDRLLESQAKTPRRSILVQNGLT